MNKQKLYCPKTMGTFRMMFGFTQPIKFILDSRAKLNKAYERRKKL